MDAHRPDISRSNALWERARKVIPAGSQTFSKAPSQFVEGVTPKYLERGDGCHVWDVDGNRFIDFSLACQPIILGYKDPAVDAAIREQLEKGIVFSLMHPLEVEVSEEIVGIVPCAEGVRFGKNGADATSAAVRVARAVTGRDHIAYCGYHGWHDWYIANTDLNSGIPEFNKQLSHGFQYNDLDSLTRIFEAHKGEVACVIMEPVTVLPPAQGFLEEVKKVAHDNGALLVYDEIITGFRYALGGAQELFGVTPDLTCLAKGMSNGMPLSAIVGRREYIFALEKTFFSFTYGGECLSLAAARATIQRIREEGVVPHLWRIGKRLQDGVNQLAQETGVHDFVQCIGYPCRSVLSFNGQGRFDSHELKTFIQQEMVKRGVLMAGYHALCYAHTDKEVDRALEAYEDSLQLLKKILDRNEALEAHLEGPVVRPVFQRVADFMSFTTKKTEEA